MSATEIFWYNPTQPLLFTQSLFWVFFGLVMLVYQVIYKKYTLRNTFLFLFSIYFYYKSSGFFFSLIIFSTLTDYLLAHQISITQSLKRKKILLVLSLIINIGLLGYFKYTYFFADLLNSLANTNFEAQNWLALLANNLFGSQFTVSKIILPVGISFYTFQTISYTVDVYRGNLKPLRNFIDFAFYVSFFPQLVAGPIVRATDFLPQVRQPYQLNKAEFSRAVFLILTGLVKKIVISDYISVNFVDRVFNTPLNYTGFENLMAVYGYALQIYCDFSGYTDIAIGLALLLGFRLPLNFNSPYKAANITDFWRRWHISLSSWLRDYLYIPLGGNRKGAGRTYLNLMLTMVLGGLWHGAHLRFVIWGTLHGAGLALHKLYLQLTNQHPNAPLKPWQRILGVAATFHLVCFAWIFFRAPNMQAVGTMLTQIFGAFGAQTAFSIVAGYHKVFWVMLLGFVMHFLPAGFKNQLQQWFGRLPLAAKAVVVAIAVLWVFQAKTSGIVPFIYFQF